MDSGGGSHDMDFPAALVLGLTWQANSIDRVSPAAMVVDIDVKRIAVLIVLLSLGAAGCGTPKTSAPTSQTAQRSIPSQDHRVANTAEHGCFYQGSAKKEICVF